MMSSLLDEINKIFAQVLGTRKNSFIYWNPPRGWKGTKYAFGYTPWKTHNDGQEGYFACKYRILKNGNQKLVKAVRFGKRRVARARAEKWYNEYYGEANQ